MFTVIELEKEKKRGLCLRRFFKKPRVEITKIPTETGKGFYICKAEVRKGKLPIKEIEAISPKGNFILPMDFHGKTPLKLFNPEKLPQLMLFNSSMEYIKEKALSPSKVSITIVDKDGLYLEHFKEVIKLSSYIAVVTSHKGYRQLSHELSDMYGVSLILRERFYEEKSENAFLLDYDGESVPLSYKGTVFSKEKKYLLSGKSLTPGGFDLPEEYERLLSKNINKLHFASALFEKSQVKELGNLKFNCLCS